MREHESREPFAYIIQDKYERERGVEGHLSRSHVSKYVSQEDINEHEITCTPLYRHAQPALDGEPVAWKWRLVDLATGDPGEWRVTLAPSLPGKGAGYRTETIPLYRHAQQPVVPPMQHWEELCREHPDMSIGDAIIRAAWWNHCRAAMLQSGNSPEIPGAEQRIADAVELLKKAAPEMLADNGGPDGPLAGRLKSPVIPEGWQVEAERLAEMHGMSFVLFRHGEDPQCADPTKVVISFTDKGLGHDTLPAAPQELK